MKVHDINGELMIWASGHLDKQVFARNGCVDATAVAHGWAEFDGTTPFVIHNEKVNEECGMVTFATYPQDRSDVGPDDDAGKSVSTAANGSGKKKRTKKATTGAATVGDGSAGDATAQVSGVVTADAGKSGDADTQDAKGDTQSSNATSSATTDGQPSVTATSEKPKKVKPWAKDVREDFSVRLTDAEINARAREAADLEKQIQEIKDEMKAEAQFNKDKIAKLDGHRKNLIVAVNEGRETRRVDCKRHYCPESRKTWLEHRGDQQMHRDLNYLEMQELDSRGGLFKDGVGGKQTKSKVSMGDELAKRVAESESAQYPDHTVPDAARASGHMADGKKPRKKKSLGVTVESAVGVPTTHIAAGSTDADIRGVMRSESRVAEKADHTL